VFDNDFCSDAFIADKPFGMQEPDVHARVAWPPKGGWVPVAEARNGDQRFGFLTKLIN